MSKRNREVEPDESPKESAGWQMCRMTHAQAGNRRDLPATHYSDWFVMKEKSSGRHDLLQGMDVIQSSWYPPNVVGVSWFSRVGFGAFCFNIEGWSDCRIWPGGLDGWHGIESAGMRPVGRYGCGGSGCVAVVRLVRMASAAMAGNGPPHAAWSSGRSMAATDVSVYQ